MLESKKETFTKDQFLTVTKFAIKYGFDKEERKLVHAAFTVLYKKNKQARTNNGIFKPVIISDRHAHDITSRYRADPMFHDIVLNEIEKQRIFAAKTKGESK
ncbi:MAG: hypothetical protein J6S74_02265 [Alphaproteobacteria bacterium]|nr:hypothetical protein [Alphaproteobacteria bacterium]